MNPWEYDVLKVEIEGTEDARKDLLEARRKNVGVKSELKETPKFRS